MKKLTSLLAMLLMVATLSFTFTSCSSITIGTMMGQLKAQCPMDWGNGLTMTNAELSGDDAIITISAPALTTSLVSTMKPAMVEAAKSDTEFSKLLKDSNTTLIYRYECSDGTADVKITPSEL